MTQPAKPNSRKSASEFRSARWFAPDDLRALLLGVGALKGARQKLAELARDFDAWEETTVGADSPKAA